MRNLIVVVWILVAMSLTSCDTEPVVPKMTFCSVVNQSYVQRSILCSADWCMVNANWHDAITLPRSEVVKCIPDFK